MMNVASVLGLIWQKESSVMKGKIVRLNQLEFVSFYGSLYNSATTTVNVGLYRGTPEAKGAMYF